MLSCENRDTCFLRDRGMVLILPIQKKGLPSVNLREQKRALETNVMWGYSLVSENMDLRDIL